MSLLLDARKKAQQAQNAPEGGREPIAETEHYVTNDQVARDAGRNLFAAKSALSSGALTPSVRNLLIALAITTLVIGAGLAYLSTLGTASDVMPARPIIHPVAPPPPAAKLESADLAEPETPQLVADVSQTTHAPDTAPEQRSLSSGTTGEPQQRSTVRVERQRTETVDPLLQDAYLAYRDGRADEARRQYQAMLARDGRNIDALLGLATIAQQGGDSMMAAQYFSRALALDPRNAVANAGMSALSTDDDRNESRLKALLREQNDSAALHFGLGNLYARQSRWGEAQQAYFNAWTLEPDNAEFAYNLAVGLDHLGQGELAAQHYRRALQLDPARRAGFDHAQVARRIEGLGQVPR